MTMGFIRAFQDALEGTFAEQWKEYLAPPQQISPTAAIFPAIPYGQNAGRGQNLKGSANIITNGSRVLVPEGTVLVCVQDGAIVACVAEPGGYIWKSDDPNSRCLFEGDGIIASTILTSWERFKFGGIPGSQQLAFYVNAKEIPDNKFGTQSTIYWDDKYLNAQAGAITRGSYTLRIIDPILFIKQFVPQSYILANAPIFDFGDMYNPASEQLFNEVVSSLGQAFSRYSADPNKGRIANIQSDQAGFAQSLGAAIEENYHWQSDRGLSVLKVAITAIEYDPATEKILHEVQAADALMGARGNSFLQQSVARGIQAAGENPNGNGALGMGFLGMGMNTAGSIMSGMQQPESGANQFIGGVVAQNSQVQEQPQSQQTAQSNAQPQTTPAPKNTADDQMATLSQYKQMLDQGLITEDDYNAMKTKVLGL